IARFLNCTYTGGIGYRMPRLDQPDSFQRKSMSMLRDDEPAGDMLAQNLLNDLRHSCACLPSTNDNEPRWNGELLAGDGEPAISELDEALNACSGIRGVQRGFPNKPRAMPKFAGSHPLRLLLSGRHR